MLDHIGDEQWSIHHQARLQHLLFVPLRLRFAAPQAKHFLEIGHLRR